MTTDPTAALSVPSIGLIDLEKELSCSICTDILYQPLTLLDCLHTFCGSCLKEWFGWQAQRIRKEHRGERGSHGAGKPSYTCPSCRAVVRETRPNAQVTTLLEMFLTANAGRSKSAADKAEIAKSYTHGEAVLPTTERRGRSDEEGRDSEEEESEDSDQRLVDHVREVSLRDIEGGAGAERQASPERRTRRHLRRREGRSTNRNDASERTEQDREARHNRAVNLGHQSSLRALLSPYNSAGMKEDIMKQIVEEGLLDDIDWDNIRPEQEDEISQRIADAYRRRRRNRSRRRSRQPSRRPEEEPQRREEPEVREEPQRSPRVESTPQTTAETTESTTSQPRATTTRPPVSRPHLLDATGNEARPRHHRRSSSQGRERTLRPAQASFSSHIAARSATDLTVQTNVLVPAEPAPRRASHESRRSTDPEGISISERWRRAAATPNVRESAASPIGPHPNSDVQQNTSAISDESAPTDIVSRQQQSQDRDGQMVTHSAQAPSISVSCDRCGRADITTLLHYSCHLCREGVETYDLCLRCFRLGRGCLHWYGFGSAAGPRFERLAAPGAEPPHILRGQKYVLPAASGSGNAASLTWATRGAEDQISEPTLETGVFCDSCHANANGCYFHCAQCNDGEWGYCHRCVNSSRCCPHLLLPLAFTITTSPVPSEAGNSQAPQQQEHADLIPLSLPTTCNSCDSAIPPTSPRLHCPSCSEGDYDICLPCYESWSQSGRISQDNGLHGWRRCLQGHRMLIVQFDIGEGNAEWRRVVANVVGGWSRDGEHDLLDSDGRPVKSNISPNSNRGWRWRDGASGAVEFKQDSGHRSVGQDTGSHAQKTTLAQALWSFWPAEDKEGELAFPRGATIEDVVDVNGDFAWGVYARRGGVFPAAYVRMM